jgi:outer membrane protein OmpA-like peptidoglycan-associated protein
MRLRTVNTIVSSSVLGLALAMTMGCGKTLPPPELAHARTEYQMALNGPAAQETPAQLHAAETQLRKAEHQFAEDGDKPEVRDTAYIALRKVQLAEAAARAQQAQKAKVAAEEEANRVQGEMLKSTQSALQNQGQALAKTQDQLNAEKAARAEAEKKAAQALADLQKIATVKQETRGMVITLSGSVLFETDKSNLLPQGQTKMNEVADALIKGNPDAMITVEGHTDSQGTRDHNQVLSQQRAESVKQALVSRGVAPDRIKTQGVGPDRPIADNKSAEGRANNRRVEIVVGAGSAGPTTTTESTTTTTTTPAPNSGPAPKK